MSDHHVSGGATGPLGFHAAVATAVRAPTTVLWDNLSQTATFRFVPDLTPAESAAFADLVAAYRTHDVSLTLPEYQAIKPDIEGLRAYYGLPSPTNAQSVAAIKGTIRILRALLRD